MAGWNRASLTFANRCYARWLTKRQTHMRVHAGPAGAGGTPVCRAVAWRLSYACACAHTRMSVCLRAVQMQTLLRQRAPSRRPARCADSNGSEASIAERDTGNNDHHQHEERDDACHGDPADDRCNGSRAGHVPRTSESMRDVVHGAGGEWIGHVTTQERERSGNRESERERVCQYVLEVIARERRRENNTSATIASAAAFPVAPSSRGAQPPPTPGDRHDRYAASARRGFKNVDGQHAAVRCEGDVPWIDARESGFRDFGLHADDDEEIFGRSGHGSSMNDAETETRTDTSSKGRREQVASQHVADRDQLPGLGTKGEISAKQDKSETRARSEHLVLSGIDGLTEGSNAGGAFVEDAKGVERGDHGSLGMQGMEEGKGTIVGEVLRTSQAWGLVQDIFDTYTSAGESVPARSEEEKITGSPPQSLSPGRPSSFPGDVPADSGGKSALGDLVGLAGLKSCPQEETEMHTAQSMAPLSSTHSFSQPKSPSTERGGHVEDAAGSAAWMRETVEANQRGASQAMVTRLMDEGKWVAMREGGMWWSPSTRCEPQNEEGIAWGAERPSGRIGVPESISPFPLREHSNPLVRRSMRVTQTNGVEVCEHISVLA